MTIIKIEYGYANISYTIKFNIDFVMISVILSYSFDE